MSIKSKVFAAAATLTLVGGTGAVGALTAGTANAETPSCGGTCIEFFNHEFGDFSTMNFVLDTLKQGEKVGQPQILFRTSNGDPAEDYTISDQGLVSDFVTAGLLSKAVGLHYGAGATLFPDLEAYEVEYSPYGVDSGLCAGVAATATAGEKVTLQPCGVSGRTVWIIDSTDAVDDDYAPLINGSDNNFSQPFVLTYPTNAYPTDMPRPALTVANLTGFQGANGLPDPGTINDHQLWGQDSGVHT